MQKIWAIYFINDNYYECYEDCSNITGTLYEYYNQCFPSCQDGTIFYNDNLYLYFDNTLYYSNDYLNFEKTECINEIRDGYYSKNNISRTIDKCQKKGKTYDFKSYQLGFCINCNNSLNYYELEGKN